MTSPSFIIGWEEWLALPDLGLPAIKAKVDTGARTSALHAFLIEPFGPASQPMVRFGVHPIPGRDDIEIYCSAAIVDRRDVTSSNGEKEARFVIATRVRMGERTWPIEITLTNRGSMSYRMLLGRQAIREDMFVEPASSFRQPKLSYKLYRHLPRIDPVRRALRIAVLTRQPDAAAHRRLAAAAEARGHVLEVLDVGRLSLAFRGRVPGISADGMEADAAALPQYDAVIPRLAARREPAGAAVLRQLEMMGCAALVGGDALERLANPIAVIQMLARHGIPVGVERLALDGTGVSMASPHVPGGSNVLLLVVGSSAIAAMEDRHGQLRDKSGRPMKTERVIAERAAAALGLGLAAVDIAATADGPAVRGVSALPPLGLFERVTGVQTREAVIAEAEARVRSWVRRGDGVVPESTAGTDQGAG